MKSFGVRLAAGAATILFGAYAAALAQKDKDKGGSEEWTADAPSLGEAAAPIAELDSDSWINQPASGQAETEPSSSIQLVQHTAGASEPTVAPRPKSPLDFAADAFAHTEEPPADREGQAPPESTELAVPEWTLPDTAGAVADGGGNAAEELTLPDNVDGPPSQPFAADQLTNSPPASPNLPELQLNAGPAIDLGVAQQPAAAVPMGTSDGPASAALGNPQNLLRDNGFDGNALRDAPLNPDSAFAQPATVAPPAGVAHQGSLVDGGNYRAQPQVQQVAPDLIPMDQGSAYQPAVYPASQQPVVLDTDVAVDAPGDRRLEGVQSPSVVIQKRAPSEVKVGQPATFAIHVQNVGATEALDVQVFDKVPSGMRLIDASPTPVQQGNALLWQLGAMPAGDERTVTMQLVPEQEGELGSVARVSFEAAASVRTISTRPELKIVQSAPDTVLIGQQLEIELEVSNPGTGEATNVVLQEDVPEGLEHPKGRQLDNAIGNLQPGEIRRQVLRMRAVAPGLIQNTIRLTADDGLVAEHTAAVQVVSPELQVELEGPSRRFLERQATYQLHVANIGTADATNIELSVKLDRGFTFVSTGNEGQYDPSRHTVYWSLAQLPAGAQGKVPLTLLPVQEGEQAIAIDARADLGIVSKHERLLSVEGFSELSFSITNPGGPIELGAETSFEINVANSGSKADSNVRVQVLLPPGLELISSDGEAQTNGQGLIAFQPKSSLPPGGELKYRLRVRGIGDGTHIVKAVVVSDQATTPVTKEESTLVYQDQ